MYISTLPRHEGQRLLDLVELALSLTPEVRRPWGHRVQIFEWEDMPSPQLVIWGPNDPLQRVIPLRDEAQPEDICTVSVPADASSFQILLAAENACPSFRRTRIAVARMEKTLFIDHQPCDPFNNGAAVGAYIGEVRALSNPHAPTGRSTGRWQPRIPGVLNTPAPRSTEDLWPVTEVVVHFSNRGPVRCQLPFTQDVSVLHAQLCQRLAVPATSHFRLPTFCPAEVGCPLHLFLHVPDVYDPWNDPSDVPDRVWALVDVRRCVSPPRPGYIMVQLPHLFI